MSKAGALEVERAFGCSAVWLMHGIGPMVRAGAAPADPVAGNDAAAVTLDLLASYASAQALTDADWKLIGEVARHLARKL